jgi:hypothetical protein
VTTTKDIAAATAAGRPSNRWRRSRWWTMTALVLATLALVSRYIGMNPANFFAQQREVYVGRETMLALHICGAGTALAIGPLQFLPRLRRGRARVHRTLGITYLAAATIGGLGGLGMASTAYSGPVASLGFGTLAVLWLACTWTGFVMVLRRRFTDHRRWMVRSFSLVFAGVTLRLILGAYGAVEGSVLSWLPFHTVYMATSWLCWVPNLVLAIWFTRARLTSATTSKGTALTTYDVATTGTEIQDLALDLAETEDV